MSSAISRTSVAAVCAATLLAACAKKDNYADSTKPADSMAAMAPAPATNPAPAPAPLTDANIAAILDNANAADSSVGHLASTKGTNAEVKAFGRDMMRDHHALRKMGQDLVKKLKVTPEMPAGDNSVAQAKSWQDSLSSMPKGAAWDKAYIDHEVTYHQAVIQTAQTAEGAAQNAELKALITKAIPNLQAHLKKAQDIQGKLGTPATP
jgi:putative membrane protein